MPITKVNMVHRDKPATPAQKGDGAVEAAAASHRERRRPTSARALRQPNSMMTSTISTTMT
jgi:hypothetical protein